MIETKDLKKYFQLGNVTIKALDGININIKRGEFVAIMGASGSGKSTLLHQLALLDNPTSGKLLVDSQDILSLSETEKTHFRLDFLGYVFQDYAILPELTALENVYLPAMAKNHKAKSEYIKRAKELLKIVGLSDRAEHLPSELSGGQQQRVAIARSLINQPDIIFADEPCANLDSASSKQVLETFKSLNKKYKQTIVMVTHEEWHKNYAHRIITLKDGKVEKITTVKKY